MRRWCAWTVALVGVVAGGAADAQQGPAPARDRAALRAAIRRELRIPARSLPVAGERYGEWTVAPGVVAERVSYATGYGLRVPAIVYRPAQRGPGRMPGLVIVNGHGGDKTSWYATWAGILYARAGALVVTYDPIGEGERNAEGRSGTRQHDTEVEPLPEMARRLGGSMITDVMQAVSYLAARRDADPSRIAVLGYSMGSFIAGLACALDTRVAACVLAAGGNFDGPGGYWDRSRPMCQGLPYQALSFLGDRGAALYDLNADRGATLVLNGTADAVVAITTMGPPFFADLRERTVALHGGTRNVFTAEFDEGGGHRPYFLTRTAARWLQERLHFPRWSTDTIDSMRETRIGDWAAANGLGTDRALASELGEGGTRALGTDIPAVPRDSLRALPLARWTRERPLYVYESWRARAGVDAGRMVRRPRHS